MGRRFEDTDGEHREGDRVLERMDRYPFVLAFMRTLSCIILKQ